MSQKIESTSDKCCEILQLTHDGDDLVGSDLGLVENAVNGNLTPRGLVVLHQLLVKCQNGYERPYFLGIDNLTRDEEGFIFWRGKQIEHYDHDHWRQDDWQKDMKKDAEDLARGCRWLEDNSIEVNFSNWFDNRHKWGNNY
jgi:hypothetical protein